MNEKQVSNFKGFDLFIDQPEPLRTRNRAVVLANIAEDYGTKDKRIGLKGSALMLGYMNVVPLEDRAALSKEFAAQMNQRGFAIVE